MLGFPVGQQLRIDRKGLFWSIFVTCVRDPLWQPRPSLILIERNAGLHHVAPPGPGQRVPALVGGRLVGTAASMSPIHPSYNCPNRLYLHSLDQPMPLPRLPVDVLTDRRRHSLPQDTRAHGVQLPSSPSVALDVPAIARVGSVGGK